MHRHMSLKYVSFTHYICVVSSIPQFSPQHQHISFKHEALACAETGGSICAKSPNTSSQLLSAVIREFVVGRVHVDETICGCRIAARQKSYQLIALSEQRTEPLTLCRSE